VRKEEQGRYEISGNILVLHISDSVTNVVDNQLHGFSKGRARTPFMTSGQSSGPSTRQCEVRILGTGTIVIDGREFKARNNW
jgi:hypothetical protein